MAERRPRRRYTKHAGIYVTHNLCYSVLFWRIFRLILCHPKPAGDEPCCGHTIPVTVTRGNALLPLHKGNKVALGATAAKAVEHPAFHIGL